tara:strand:- start:436 stop:594 length:159 start_codon:yes stop_codon:yes gene_type:complete
MSKYINVQMKREIHAIVKEHCNTSKQTISGCIEDLVETYLKKSVPTNILKVK